MSRVTYTELNTLPDLLDQTGFRFILGNAPGAGSLNDLTLNCQNVTIPGTGQEAWEANLHGHVRKFRGRRTYPRTLQVTYLEDSRFTVHTKIRSWLEYIAGSESGNSQGYSNQYKVLGSLLVLDTTGRVIESHQIEGVMPQDLGDVSMDGGSSGQVAVSVTFSYDRFTSGQVPRL